MSAPLALLHARRTAPVSALCIVAATVLVARRLAPTGEAFATPLEASRDGGTQAAWALGLGVAAILVLLHAARTPHRWLTDEGDWIGATAVRRTTMIASTLTGIAAGCAALALTIAVVAISTGARSPGAPLLERSAVAGPTRSIVLQPGEAFEQSLGGRAVAVGASVRVRVAPTLGGETPTTDVRIEAGAGGQQARIARRTWLDAAASTGSLVRIENVGTGALAVLGPQPVELWEPSPAWFSGHLRVAHHGGLWLVTLSALAFGFGCTMGPVIAALFALSLWVGAGMLLNGSALGPWVPGGDALAAALDAVHAGSAPRPPAATTHAAAGLTVLASIGFARATLRSWRQELRG